MDPSHLFCCMLQFHAVDLSLHIVPLGPCYSHFFYGFPLQEFFKRIYLQFYDLHPSMCLLGTACFCSGLNTRLSKPFAINLRSSYLCIMLSTPQKYICNITLENQRNQVPVSLFRSFTSTRLNHPARTSKMSHQP